MYVVDLPFQTNWPFNSGKIDNLGSHALCQLATINSEAFVPRLGYEASVIAADLRGGTISIIYSTCADTMTDAMIILLPLHMLSQLQVSKRQKAGLAGVFSIGVINIVVAINTDAVPKEENDEGVSLP